MKRDTTRLLAPLRITAYLCCSLGMLLAAPQAEAQIIAWDMDGLAGDEASVPATTLAAGLNTVALVRGPGINAAGLANAFHSNQFTEDGTFSDAVTNGDYLEFSVSVLEGGEFSLSTLDARFRRSGTGPDNFQWQYSLDGFATPGVNIGSSFEYTGTATNGDAQAQIDLSGIGDLQDVDSDAVVTIRLYGWGASATGGTFSIGRVNPPELAIGGTVDAPPIPIIQTSVGSLGAFTTDLNVPSASQSYTVDGLNLGEDITVTAPAGFEVSLDDAAFSGFVNVPQTDGSASATVYARLTGASVGLFSGNITHTSTGATTQNVAVSGEVEDDFEALEGDIFLSYSADEAEAAVVYPHDDWGVHGPGESFEFAADDWRYDGTVLTFYVVPAEGTEFGMASFVVSWDDTVLGFIETSPDGGLFEDSSFFSMHPNGSTSSVQIDVAHNANFTVADVAGGDQFIASLTFDLLRPGHSEINLSDLDFRAHDGVGGQLAVTTESHDGVLRAFLGDVVDSTSGLDESTGDGVINFEDLMLFSGAYWAGVPGGPDPTGENYMVKYDVGPTDDTTVFTFPVIDDQIQFEDLVIFSISYGLSANDAYPRPVAPAHPQFVTVSTAPAQVHGDELRIPIVLSEVMDLRALALEFAVDTDVFDVLGAEAAAGGIIPADAPVFMAGFSADGAGMTDAAGLGEEGLHGAGQLLEIRVQTLSGSPADFEGSTDVLHLTDATLRTSANQDIPSEIGEPVSVDGDGTPLAFALEANYPNPFVSSTTIGFSLPEAAPVRLVVYDALGRQVALLVNEELSAGRHSVVLDAGELASGTYLYRIEAGASVETRRLTVIR